MALDSIDMENFSNGELINGEWIGTGVFDKIMHAVNENVKKEYDANRITGENYGDVYLGGLQSAISEGMRYIMSSGSIEKDIESKDVAIAMQEVQLAENSEKWALQKKVLENQLQMSDIDVAYKERNVKRDLEIRDKQIQSADADIEFNVSKKLIMEQTRKDNIRSKAAEQFAEFMKYISAANVVPGPTDFQNMRNLITAMNSGIANPDNVATITTSGADFVKPA